MLEKIPSNSELQALLGVDKFTMWNRVCALINGLYEMDTMWNSGGKKWKFEYKYRRGGKTLCALYAKEDCFGVMVILGKEERAKFENERESFSEIIQRNYDDTTTYHDGKWMMIEPTDVAMLEDIERLLRIKRRPNRT